MVNCASDTVKTAGDERWPCKQTVQVLKRAAAIIPGPPPRPQVTSGSRVNPKPSVIHANLIIEQYIIHKPIRSPGLLKKIKNTYNYKLFTLARGGVTTSPKPGGIPNRIEFTDSTELHTRCRLLNATFFSK